VAVYSDLSFTMNQEVAINCSGLVANPISTISLSLSTVNCTYQINESSSKRVDWAATGYQSARSYR
jgi:hypothetical protein